ncbi:DUF3304 domain-containing protein [Stutzerimonas nitrititolerans]|uniref:DUF3304 domain-containing protein n=1 Tax=Stutzerimonas nitrititolerans TaxID=2482751 RepID=UPI0028AF4AD9|nr:DUF3304 domain-containing protein [Stutzerimonas nitrititolerans]
MSRLHSLRTHWRALSPLHKGLLQLLFWGALAVAYVIWQALRMPGAALYGHNHTDRPIFSYFVNDNWGGNAAAHGGGGMTCCWRIEGETLKVEWIKGRTGEQVRQGIQKETLTLELPNPPRRRTDDTLHVHFLPGDQVRLAWSDAHTSPLREELSDFYARDKEAKTR